MKYQNRLAVQSVELTDQLSPHSDGNSITTLDLCRHVIDDLIDQGLTGLLLSATHLRRYFGAYLTYAPRPVARTLARVVANVAAVDEIHTMMLELFKGLYIEEASITDRQELLAELDAKFLLYASKLNFKEVQSEPSRSQIESIELAWRYRVACAKGTQIGVKQL